MKTPREILLARHCSAEPKLDSIRERAVAGLETKSHEQSVSWFESLREMFRVPRIAWAGLAAAWCVIIALNVASRETAPSQPAPQEAKRSPETLLALREQKRLFSELVGLANEKLDTDAPRFVPRPRSEALPLTACV